MWSSVSLNLKLVTTLKWKIGTEEIYFSFLTEIFIEVGLLMKYSTNCGLQCF